MKQNVRFVCNECGAISQSWIGKCPECLSWNTLVKEVIEDQKKKPVKTDNPPVRLSEVQIKDNSTITLKNDLVNRFFGEGIISGATILIAGEPGVGKSTFLLFLSDIVPEGSKIYYFSGEESVSQIKRRALRIGAKNNSLYLSNTSCLEQIIKKCSEDKPDFIFIDSIQTVYSKEVDSGAGSVTQIKQCASELINYSKETGTPLIIVGHITKQGDIAGPKVLEHMVDAVVYFMSDIQPQYRVIRSIKNRYGSVNEILLFEMKEDGLKPVQNSTLFFAEKDDNSLLEGRVRTALLEGRAPIITILEALVVPSVYASPRIVSEALDNARISRISAIMIKHLGENLNNYDLFVNIAGGLKTKDVAGDLAIAACVYSSKHRFVIDNYTAFIGELSLSGKVISVPGIEIRIRELANCGFKKIFLPSAVKGAIKDITGVEYVFVKIISELPELIKPDK